MVGRLVSAAIALYRVTLGAILGGQCRFYPSCSEYARLAFRQLPFGRALRLSLWRLARCHPFSAGGVDGPPPLHSKIPF